MSNTMPKFLQIMKLSHEIASINLGDNVKAIAPGEEGLIIVFKNKEVQVFDPTSFNCLSVSGLMKQGVNKEEAAKLVKLLEETYGEICPVRKGFSEEVEVEKFVSYLDRQERKEEAKTAPVEEKLKGLAGKENVMAALSSAFVDYMEKGEVTSDHITNIRKELASALGMTPEETEEVEEEEEDIRLDANYTEDRTGLKDKLRTGYTLINRAGHQFIVFKGTERGDVVVRDYDNKCGFKHMTLNQFNDDMTGRIDSSKDIVAVYSIKDFYSNTDQPRLLFRENESNTEELALKEEIAKMQKEVADKQRELEKLRTAK